MKNWKKILLSFVSILSISLFPVMFLYCSNIAEVRFSEIFEPLGMFLLIAVSLWIVSSIIYKNILKGAFVSDVFMLIFLNYSIINSILIKMDLKYWHIITIVLFIFGHIFYFVYKWSSENSIFKILQLISTVFCILIIINIIPIIPKIMNHNTSDVTNISAENKANADSSKEYPDVYYIILDEYASFDVMEKYYGYYPEEFEQFLKSNNFAISSASSNESYWTHITTTNTLDLNYTLGPKATVEEALEYRTNPKLFQLFESYGYHVNVASEAYPLGWKGVEYTAENPFGDQVIGKLKEFRSMVYKKTPLFILDAASFDVTASEVNRTIVNKLFDYIELNSQHSEEQPNFYFVHIRSPHQPFVFDANGNEVPSSQMLNWEDKKYYLEQYQYATKRVQTGIEKIVKDNPNSIIILQSDHSARGGDVIPIEEDDKIKILNAVRYGSIDIPINIEQQSALNTCRLLLNELFGLDYPLLEVPKNER